MTKRKFLTIALEDTLETEKLLQSSEVTAGGGDFSSLRDSLSNKLDTMIHQRDNPVESTSDYGSSDETSGGGDASADDTGVSGMGTDDIDFGDTEDTATEPEPEEDIPPDDKSKDDTDDSSGDKKSKGADKDKKKDTIDKDSKEATEHAALFVANTTESLEREFRLIDAGVAKEDGITAAGVWEGIKTVGAGAYAVGNTLAYIGVNILAPAFKHLYKGVIYLSAKFIRYSHAGITKIDAEVESFTNRLSKTTKEIEAAREIIALIKKKKAEFPDSVPDKLLTTFDKSKVIGRIKLGKIVSPVDNCAVISTFLTKWYGKTSRDIEKDSAAIKQVLYYGVQTAINPVKTFGDSSLRNGLIHDSSGVKAEGNEFVSAMRYQETLPGNLYYSCIAPNGKASSIEDVRLAYAASGCSFNIDMSTFVRIERIDYMDLNSVEKSLDAVANLVKTLEKQKDIYKTIKGEKTIFLNSFKRYLYRLADESERISLEKSMLEYVYLRGVFIDTVYTVTSRDIHEYTHKYLANVMIYLRSNLEELSS